MKRIAKVVAVVGLSTMLVVAALVLFLFSFHPEDRAMHIARVDWLPAEASDVTYVKRGGFGSVTCFECDLPKDAFDRMAGRNGWKPEPKKNVSIGLRSVLGLPALKATEYGQMDLVANALFYENRRANNGGITVVYDLDSNRLFVHESQR